MVLSTGNVSSSPRPSLKIFDIAIFLDTENVPAEALAPRFPRKEGHSSSATPRYLVRRSHSGASSSIPFALYKGALNAFPPLDAKHAHPVLFSGTNEDLRRPHQALPQPASAPSGSYIPYGSEAPGAPSRNRGSSTHGTSPERSLAIIAFPGRHAHASPELDSLLRKHKGLRGFHTTIKRTRLADLLKTPGAGSCGLLTIPAEVDGHYPGLGTELIGRPPPWENCISGRNAAHLAAEIRAGLTDGCNMRIRAAKMLAEFPRLAPFDERVLEVRRQQTRQDKLGLPGRGLAIRHY